MEPRPDISVVRRKPLRASKMAKRLKRFLKDNRPPDLRLDADGGDQEDDELVCKISEDILFQLQQIHDTLTGKAPADLSALIAATEPPQPTSQVAPEQTEVRGKKLKREAEVPGPGLGEGAASSGESGVKGGRRQDDSKPKHEKSGHEPADAPADAGSSGAAKHRKRKRPGESGLTMRSVDQAGRAGQHKAGGEGERGGHDDGGTAPVEEKKEKKKKKAKIKHKGGVG